MSVRITKAMREGMDKINIQLRPASLGRIDVELQMGPDGKVVTTITADNRQTLDLLQRDARSLERSLQDAGLQADAGSMSFNLREQNDRGGREAHPSTVLGDVSGPAVEEPVADSLESIVAAERQSRLRAEGRVDITI